jgi:hypothetical protein
LVAADDARAADWLVAGVRNFDHTVGSIVPAGFEAYARVFHPAWREDGAGRERVRWSGVAAARGRVMHPVAEWGSLNGSWQEDAGRASGLWDESPEIGALATEVAGSARHLGQRRRQPAPGSAALTGSRA